MPLDADAFLAAADIGSGGPAVSVGQSTAVNIVRDDPVVSGFANWSSEAGDVACGDPELATSENLGSAQGNGSDCGEGELHFESGDECEKGWFMKFIVRLDGSKHNLTLGISRTIYTSGYLLALRLAMAAILTNIVSVCSNTQNPCPKIRTIVLHAQHLHAVGCVAWKDRDNIDEDLQCYKVKNSDIEEGADRDHYAIHVRQVF